MELILSPEELLNKKGLETPVLSQIKYFDCVVFFFFLGWGFGQSKEMTWIQLLI